jgi:hypothetical protein
LAQVVKVKNKKNAAKCAASFSMTEFVSAGGKFPPCGASHRMYDISGRQKSQKSGEKAEFFVGQHNVQ